MTSILRFFGQGADMDYKMIAVDLDGTLYSDEKEILPETAAALKKAAAHSCGSPIIS